MTARLKARLIATSLVFCGASLLAQAPAPATQTHTSNLGFSYALPTDWQVMEAPPTLSDMKQQQAQEASSESEKKGIECIQIAMTARHGDPTSMVVVMALPFGCFGQPMTEKDLPGFAEGASEGLKKTLVISAPAYGSYTLGSHNVWIERAQGALIGHPEAEYTAEVACTLLKKSAACWMAMAADPASLKTFEQGMVTLDGEPPTALVPATAFDKKPAQ